MYFALLGKTPDLSLAELELLHATITGREGSFIFFDAPQGIKAASNLAGIIKRGRVVDEKDLGVLVKDAPLIGVTTNTLGVYCKKTYGVKRFKIIADAEKSDLEVKKGGIELVELGKEKVGVVEGRQDIDRFEAMDFEKPVRGMQVGMMPAKLTQMLINIGVAQTGKNIEDEITVYDPFVGFGTTVWIANSLGYNAIGSDINISPAKQNHKRRPTTSYATLKHITFFKHDVKDSFDQPFLKHVSAIVTEGRLGPIVNKQVAHDTGRVKTNISQIVELYSSFLKNTKAKLPNVPIVMTVPVYLFLDRSTIEESIFNVAKDLGYDPQTIGEIYSRKGQLVGRRVVILK